MDGSATMDDSTAIEVSLLQHEDSEVDARVTWNRKLLCYGIAFAMVAAPAFCGKNYSANFSACLSNWMPVLASLALILFVFAQHADATPFAPIFIAVGFICIDLLVVISILPKGLAFKGLQTLIFLPPALFLGCYCYCFKKGGNNTAVEGTWLDNVIQQAWKTLAIVMFGIVGVSLVTEELVISFIRVYAFTIFILLRFSCFVDIKSTSAHVATWTAGWLQVPMVVTTIVGETFPQMAVGIYILLCSFCLAATSLLYIFEIITVNRLFNCLRVAFHWIILQWKRLIVLGGHIKRWIRVIMGAVWFTSAVFGCLVLFFVAVGLCFVPKAVWRFVKHVWSDFVEAVIQLF